MNFLGNEMGSLMEILNSKEAAELMRVSVPTIRGMAASGEIPATQFGDDWRFLKSLLIKYVETRSIAEQRQRQENYAKPSVDTEPVLRRGRPSKKVDLSGYVS